MGVLTATGPDPYRAALKLRAEALFASNLQASDRPSAEQVRRAVATTLQRLGTAGCAARLAGEFGDHPELAASRMSWALATVRGNPAVAPARRSLLLAG
jgi:hypothetical protein